MSEINEKKIENDELSEKDKFYNYINSKIITSGLPKEYLSYAIKDSKDKKGYNIYDSNQKINPTKQRALDITIDYILNLKNNFKEGKSLFYFGPPNKKLGLSLLGTFIIRAAIENRYSAKFVYFPALCEDLGYGVSDEEKEDYYESDFLMIDSISSKSQSNSKIADGFADIVLYRKRYNLPTIFSSYITPEELSARYSESLISYLDDFVSRIELQHEDTHAGILYDMDKLIKYMREKNKEKNSYSYAEIQALIDRFVNSYQFQ